MQAETQCRGKQAWTGSAEDTRNENGRYKKKIESLVAERRRKLGLHEENCGYEGSAHKEFHNDGRDGRGRCGWANRRIHRPVGRGSCLRPYHHKGAWGVTHHGFGDAAEKRSLHPAATMTADDEKVGGPLFCGLHDLL
jgi:hypothetical protein